MLELKGLSYQVEDNGVKTEILRGIDLTIEDNKFVVITGPNGGGKTTLAKTIMGLAMSTGGQIVWNGTDISGLSITERAKLGISYEFQQPPRFKGLRGAGPAGAGLGKRKLTRDECCSYRNRVGLCAADYVDREVDTSLSGGEVALRLPPFWPGPAACSSLTSRRRHRSVVLCQKATETFRMLHGTLENTIIVISHRSGSSTWPMRSS